MTIPQTHPATTQRADLPGVPELSGFESRCLSKKLCDCETMLRQALLGASEVQAKTHAAPDAILICECLARAEHEVEHARAIAAGLISPAQPAQGGKP